MVVYIDSVFFLNLLANYLLLISTVRLCGLPPQRGRLLAAATLGAAYAVAVFVLPIDGFLWKIFVACIMVYTAFGDRRSFFRSLFLFLGLSCAFAGCVLALGILSDNTQLLTRGVFFADISWRILLIASMAAYLVLNVVFRGSARHDIAKELLAATITRGGRTVSLTVLRDTGNTLTDPLTGRAVLVVWQDALAPLWSAHTFETFKVCRNKTAAETLEHLHAAGESGFRLLPYRSVGVSAGLLLVMQSDLVEISGRKYQNVPVALSPTPVSDGGGYSGLWGGEHEKEETSDGRMAARR
ncbi:MAG: sigma-E processing peptidase SpoIIGA [Oscillospiraceae bacterium]|nr:sigma-E processing peptidase SpoIIGA [Oscillospiraceae bacterium]